MQKHTEVVQNAIDALWRTNARALNTSNGLLQVWSIIIVREESAHGQDGYHKESAHGQDGCHKESAHGQDGCQKEAAHGQDGFQQGG